MFSPQDLPNQGFQRGEWVGRRVPQGDGVEGQSSAVDGKRESEQGLKEH